MESESNQLPPQAGMTFKEINLFLGKTDGYVHSGPGKKGSASNAIMAAGGTSWTAVLISIVLSVVYAIVWSWGAPLIGLK
jgi:hypothetical protein